MKCTHIISSIGINRVNVKGVDSFETRLINASKSNLLGMNKLFIYAHWDNYDYLRVQLLKFNRGEFTEVHTHRYIHELDVNTNSGDINNPNGFAFVPGFNYYQFPDFKSMPDGVYKLVYDHISTIPKTKNTSDAMPNIYFALGRRGSSEGVFNLTEDYDYIVLRHMKRPTIMRTYGKYILTFTKTGRKISITTDNQDIVLAKNFGDTFEFRKVENDPYRGA